MTTTPSGRDYGLQMFELDHGERVPGFGRALRRDRIRIHSPFGELRGSTLRVGARFTCVGGANFQASIIPVHLCHF